MSAQANTIPEALRDFDLLPPSAFVSQKVVEALFDISGATVWRRVRTNDLPAPHRFGKRTTRWRVGELRKVQAGEGTS